MRVRSLDPSLLEGELLVRVVGVWAACRTDYSRVREYADPSTRVRRNTPGGGSRAERISQASALHRKRSIRHLSAIKHYSKS